MYQKDKALELQEDDCPRCGHKKFYHEKHNKQDGGIPCIRKKPYKLRDGVDVKVGMQVWICQRYRDTDPKNKNVKLRTGVVRFIYEFGELCIWKYPEDRDPTLFANLSMDGFFDADHSCFSSEENAEKYRQKEMKKIE